MKKKLTKQEFIKQLNDKRYAEYVAKYDKENEKRKTIKAQQEQAKKEIQIEKERKAEYEANKVYGYKALEIELNKEFKSDIKISNWVLSFIIDGVKQKNWKYADEFHYYYDNAINTVLAIQYLKSMGVK